MKRDAVLVHQVRQELRRKGSPSYAARMQMFFKAPVRAYGWRAAEVRKLAGRLRRRMGNDPKLLLEVATQFFASPTLEEQTLAVVLLERSLGRFGSSEFRQLERWLRWVGNWSACDALCGSLLGPLILSEDGRFQHVFRWAQAKNYWYRRAAAVSLVPAARQGVHLREILRLADHLLEDEAEMVQKGVGWLLKEAGQPRRQPVVSFLLRVKKRAPRLVLRTACEKLTLAERKRILA